MFSLTAYLYGFVAMLALAVATWLVSLAKKNVSIVDSVWALFFIVGALVYVKATPSASPRDALVLVLVAFWALRLSGYITWRNWGHGEDYRYQVIRERNSPNFALKSLYIVFALQAVLASIVSLPLLAALASRRPLNMLDSFGIVLFFVGLLFETVADAQLARFKSDPENRGEVLDHGLWRYSRHPNYFGEFCVWWGFYLVGVAGGGWWSILGPALMSFLLLKVSGVVMLEKTIGERRPDYHRYVTQTNAFFPWKPRKP
jgi:steroid 5-alpha reductase family enzyme